MSGESNGQARGPAAVIFATIIEGVGAILVIGLLGFVVADIIGRLAFSKPTVHAEVIEFFAMVTGIFGIAVLATSDRAAILWPPRQSTVGPASFWTWLGPLCMAALMIVVALVQFGRAAQAIETKELSMTASLPIAPIMLLAAAISLIGMALATANMLRAFLTIGPLAPKDPELDI